MLEFYAVHKTGNYFEKIVTPFTNEQFMQHFFRVSRHASDDLAQRLNNFEYFRYQERDFEKFL